MKTNKQSKIKVKDSGYRKSRFNWSHDVNTTFRWGELQPTMCKLIVPNSKTTMQKQDLIRLAPMVAPTFGRVKYKTFSQFVDIAEVFPNWDLMMAQMPKSTAFGTKVPQRVPTIKLGVLSSYCLQGARASLYWVDESVHTTNTDRKNAAIGGLYVTECRETLWSNQSTACKNMLSYVQPSSSPVFQVAYTDYLSTSTDALCAPGPSTIKFVPSASRLTSVTNNIWSATDPIPVIQLSNDATASGSNGSGIHSLLPMKRGASGVDKAVAKAGNLGVSFNSADFVWEFSVTENGNEHYYALLLEFSDFGKRIRKIIQGLGYQFDVASTLDVSILPLLAQYKAYFDIFGLQLYQGWETTWCAKLIKIIENEFLGYVGGFTTTGMADYISPLGTAPNQRKEFLKFVFVELVNEFYTEDTDYISAHLASLSVSPVVDTSKFISVDSYGIGPAKIDTITSYNSDGTNASQVHNGVGSPDQSVQPNNAAGFISQIQHGQVDAKLLMRMYRWVNRNSILGREIAKILRAQGLGYYVYSCKSNFIASSDTIVTISDVVSQAATDQAVLGEYGGRGLQYDSSGVVVFENDNFGYWITLATIVPEAGYTQGIDPTLSCAEKFDFYLPDFDAVGMEATQKNVVCGSNFIAGPLTTGYDPNATFGFIPRMSKFKVCQNLTNGDFNRHNMRNLYMPYTLDKQLSYNDFDLVIENYDDSGSNHVIETNLGKTQKVTDMPCAGNVWRIPTKYNWLGNFDRIFYKTYEDGRSLWERGASLNEPETTAIGFRAFNDDNFLAHSIYDVQCYAPMKPIEDSYGLEDDDEQPVSGVDYQVKA